MQELPPTVKSLKNRQKYLVERSSMFSFDSLTCFLLHPFPVIITDRYPRNVIPPNFAAFAPGMPCASPAENV
ncbi:MAG: hypothetical protein RBG13Loki_0339 [Promethearchaeota archaeon CR_4]|nr:MAG: hypothetical protein RBG13Loki_0339 [Candidatus Lokiarchaeota archaeon CR_4]